MYLRTTFLLALLLIMAFSFTVQAENETAAPGLMGMKVPRNKNIIVFHNEKGEVVFNHAIHAKKFKEADCILCHRTDKPTKDKILTRFDDHRIAHYFCKGCHREMNAGPIDCHECHNHKKKKK